MGRSATRQGHAPATRYSALAHRKVARALHEQKRGVLRSGRSGAKVTSRKQAIAIGLAEAARAGARVPPARGHAGSRSKSRHAKHGR